MDRERVIIQDLRKQYDLRRDEDVLALCDVITKNGYRFETREGMDFDDEVFERAEKIRAKMRENGYAGVNAKSNIKRNTKQSSKRSNKNKSNQAPAKRIDIRDFDKDMQQEIRKQLKARDVRRIVVLSLCFIVAFACIGFFFLYYYKADQSAQSNMELAQKVKETTKGQKSQTEKVETYFDESAGEEKTVILQILEKYEDLYNMNQNLIGWIKIADNNNEKPFIDYPVMQSEDGEHYLHYNFEEKKDANGCIFLDKDCSIVKRNDNMIIYGHHMKSGNMFGNLDKYANKDFYEKHKYIQFDTLYEEGVYEVMFVFRSKIYTEDSIVFKYYQFIDANSAEEFDACLDEMRALSLYDTGVTAGFGDELLTLSTCDYREKNGRFVVVARRMQ